MRPIIAGPGISSEQGLDSGRRHNYIPYMRTTSLELMEQVRGLSEEQPKVRTIIPLSLVLMGLAAAVILFNENMVHFSHQWNVGTDEMKWGCTLTGLLSVIAGVKTVHSCARSSSDTNAFVFSWFQVGLFVASVLFAMLTWGKIY